MAVQIGQIHFLRGCIVFHSENGPKLPSSFPITDEHLDACSFSLTGSAAQYSLSLANLFSTFYRRYYVLINFANLSFNPRSSMLCDSS